MIFYITDLQKTLTVHLAALFFRPFFITKLLKKKYLHKYSRNFLILLGNFEISLKMLDFKSCMGLFRVIARLLPKYV